MQAGLGICFVLDYCMSQLCGRCEVKFRLESSQDVKRAYAPKIWVEEATVARTVSRRRGSLTLSSNERMTLRAPYEAASESMVYICSTRHLRCSARQVASASPGAWISGSPSSLNGSAALARNSVKLLDVHCHRLQAPHSRLRFIPNP